MIYILYFVLAIAIIFVFAWIRKRGTFGFYIVLGEFGSGKTQNTTGYLKYITKKKQVNITNYFTGYSDFQLSSHEDIINILDDIYQYHDAFQLLQDVHDLYKHKKEHLEGYLLGVRDFARDYVGQYYASIFSEYIDKFYRVGEDQQKYFDYYLAYQFLPKLLEVLKQEKYFEQFPQNMKFNIVLDEGSIYFNPRNFAKNFSGKNERLLEFIYQPRKLNVLMFVVVQSPMELDVKFRRLAQYYRKYYTGLRFYRWYKDFYFLNPEEMDLEKAEQVGGGMLLGANINLYNKHKLFKWISYPNYKYNTKELIRVGQNIYQKGALFVHLKNLLGK